MSLRLLYIEDNETIRKRVSETLRENDFFVREIGTVADARRAFDEGNFDLVLLDVLLPDGNGIDLLRELRGGKNVSVPVIILSALGEEIDERVSGLDAGANDYLAKPFSTRELIARIRVAVRNIASRTGAAPAVPATIRLNGGTLDLQQPWIFRDDGSQILLSMKEFCLLRYLAENAGKVVDVKEIINCVWGLNPERTSTASPVVFISRLRRKLEGLCRIDSVRGTGYKFEFNIEETK